MLGLLVGKRAVILGGDVLIAIGSYILYVHQWTCLSGSFGSL